MAVGAGAGGGVYDDCQLVVGCLAPNILYAANAMPPRPSRTSSLRPRCLGCGASISPLRAAATALPRFLVSPRASSVASSTLASAAVSAGRTVSLNLSRASETYGAALPFASDR